MQTVVSKGNSGFTLIELMVVIVILSILAAIATPMYAKYVQTAQRSLAESTMQGLSSELERWRAKNLSYSGFVPSMGYESSTGNYANKSILLPNGSTSLNYKYRILIMDGACRTPLNPTTPIVGCSGQSWVMVARPFTGDPTDTGAPSGLMGSASRLVLDSQGVRCMTAGTLTDRIQDILLTFGTNPPTTPNGALCSSGLNKSVPWK
ncbi:MAG: prepilin-type N-terminal cleavage/methylation domain-containing protein [Gammaproteobacteria bacterium]|nr:prepilin-type N-terminal cleavage/methylation domain-containing protein [Gammaproteobacteria bacterium]